MRAALIGLPQPGESALPAIAGQSLARRQLAFAREAGCTAVIAYGGGASADAIDLRHAAERAGMKYQVISTTHALPGIIGDDDSLLVLQPGLLPESRTALDLLRAEGDRVLIVSAGPGATAGLERIDLDRAWAGALTIPGKWLGKVASLPEDAAPQPALLRIAMQQRLPEARLADTMLDDGKWSVITSQEMAAQRAATWQRIHLGETPAGALSQLFGRLLVAGPGRALLDLRFARPAMLALIALLLGGGVAAGFHEMPVLGFALTALAVPVLETFLAMARLTVAPFGKLRRLAWLRWLVDAALLVQGVMAIDGLAHRTLFPPLMLVSALLLLDRKALRSWLEPVRDRMLVATLLAAVSAVIPPEQALMLASLLVIAANLLPDRR